MEDTDPPSQPHTMAADTERDITLTVTKASYWQPVALDTDGTPLHHGERMVEVQPGVWKDPIVVQIEAFLAAHMGTD